MNAQDSIRMTIEQCHMVTQIYLADMSDSDLLVRSLPGTNHIAWQLGHLVGAEQQMISGMGYDMPALPDGFNEAHGKEAANSDDPAKFLSKDEYVKLMEQTRQATFNALANTSDADLQKPGPEQMREYAPTVAHVFTLIGTHELMHAGQFVPIRRKLGKPVVI